MQIERDDEVNWSSLRYMLVSPKHYLWNLANPRTDTDALRLGRAMHCLVLEPDEFGGRYAVEPRFNRACNDSLAVEKGYSGGKQAAAAWLANVGDREVIPAEMYATACAMRDALLADPVAAPHFAHGHSEHRINWTDESTGIKCRGRVDKINGCLSDVKSTRALISCERDAAKFFYPSQLSWYAAGLREAGITTDGPPCNIFVENVPPHDVLVLTYDEQDLALGRRSYRAALDRLAECRRTGLWPGVSNGVARRIVLPPWAGTVEEEITLDGEKL